MTTPRHRQSNGVHPVLKRAAPRPGWDNQNAKRHPTDLVLYQATVELHRLLARGPVLRSIALAYLRHRSIGSRTAQAAAALIGVPSLAHAGKSSAWQFPEPAPHLPALLERIVQHGRHVGKEAQHQRGRGDEKVEANKNAIPLSTLLVRKTHPYEFCSPETSR